MVWDHEAAGSSPVTSTKIKAVDSLESTAFIILSTHFYSFFANELSGNPLFTILQSHYKRYVMVTASSIWMIFERDRCFPLAKESICSELKTKHVSNLWQHRIIPALRLKHCSGGCGTASVLPKCSIMSGCGTRIVLRGKSPSHSATAAPASVRCFRHWRRSPLQHPVLSALLA